MYPVLRPPPAPRRTSPGRGRGVAALVLLGAIALTVGGWMLFAPAGARPNSGLVFARAALPPPPTPTLAPCPPAGGDPNVVAYGDSVSIGAYHLHGNLTPYAAYLARLVAGSCGQAVEVAYTGYTAAQILGLLRGQTVRVHAAQVVVVQAGENDVRALQAGAPPPPILSPPPTPLGQYTRDYGALVAAAVADNPSARLLCTGIWFYDETAPNVVGDIVAQYEAINRTTCAAHGGIFVPLQPLCAQAIYHHPQPTTDGYHPNEIGQQAIAVALYAALDA